MVRCPDCGSSNRIGSRYCSECGSSLPVEESIRCPMCGALNPGNNVRCESCGARVVPLEAPFSPGGPARDGRAPDAGVSAEDFEPEETPAGQMPLKEPSLPGTPAQGIGRSVAPDEGGGTGDWLSDLRAVVPEDVYGPEDSGDTGELDEVVDLPEWLRGDVSVADAISPGPAPTGEAVFDGLMPENGELPDWLQEIAPASDKVLPPEATPVSETSAQVEGPVETDQRRGFVSRISSGSSADATPRGASEERHGQGLSATEDAGHAAHTRESPGAGEGLSEERPAQADVPARMQETESASGDSNKVAAVEVQDAGEVDGADVIPDWLRDTAWSGEIAAGSSDTESPVFKETGQLPQLPDWLREMSVDAAGPTEKGLGTETRVFKETGQLSELPDWPDGVVSEVDDSAESSQGEESATAEGEIEIANLPSWLRDIMPGETPEGIGVSADQAEFGQEVTPPIEVPEWLQRASPESQPGVEPEWVAAEAGIEGAERLGLDETLPASLSANEEEPYVSPEMTSDGETSGELSESAEPVGAKGLGAGVHVSPEDVGVRDSAASAELEDSLPPVDEIVAAKAAIMLDSDRESVPDVSREPSEAPPVFDLDEDLSLTASLELSRAEIPEWLEALEPDSALLESAAEEELIETGGVLDGLRGVLPAIPIASPEDTGESAVSAEVPESVIARAQLFQGLLARTPEMAKPEVIEHRVDTSLQIQRWLVTIAIVAAVLGTLVLPLLVRPVPEFANPGAELLDADSVFSLVEGLGPADTVLVAFEYGPAEADELDLVATAILRHLVAKNVGILPVSTRPEGPAMAVRVLNSIAPSGNAGLLYELGGYRPGGGTAVAYWLHSLEIDPAAVLVVTANPANLRWWIEQTQMLDGDLPVAAGVGASLEPVAGPYFDGHSRRLAGAVGGLAGAAYYEKTLLGLNGEATRRLDALAVGHVVIAGLIAVGAVVYGLGGAGRKRE